MGAGKSSVIAPSPVVRDLAAQGQESAERQLSPGSTRLIVELPASRVPRRADSSNYQPDSSNYQPDSSNYQLKADNPADNPAVSFVVHPDLHDLYMYSSIHIPNS